LRRREKKRGKKRKQSEPGEGLSQQEGISNQIYFESAAGVFLVVLVVQNLQYYIIFIPWLY
jgi:hypothetical protein